MKTVLIVFLVFVGALLSITVYNAPNHTISRTTSHSNVTPTLHPLAIESLRKGNYPGSDLLVEEALPRGSNYTRYVTSYKSEGLKIYALLTIPDGVKPKTGWPVIVFNHGYIPPQEYRTTERYTAYTDAFSRNGYVVFKSDYRGHGSSEGIAAGGYGSNDYTIDVLNAVSSIKKYNDADPERIGMWGHSMGGFVTLRNMVSTKDVKAGVIWGGVVASYPDIVNNWRRARPPASMLGNRLRGWRQGLISTYGDPDQNPAFWNSISANSYLADISGPVELHHGLADESVPPDFSTKLEVELKAAGKPVALYTYPSDDHNISGSFGTAIQRSVDFFDQYLK